MNKIGGPHVAWAIAVVSVLMMLTGISLTATYIVSTARVGYLLSHQALIPFSTLAYVLVGLLVASRHPRNPVGWIFAAVGFLHGLNALGVGAFTYSSMLGHSDSVWVRASEWVNRWSWIPGIFLPTAFVFLYFPDGRLPSPRWRPISWAAVLGLAGILAGAMFFPGELPDWGIDQVNPYGIASMGPQLELAVQLGTFLAIVGFVGSIAALIVRFRRSSGIEREQMKWIVYASIWMVVAFAAGSFVWYLVPDSSAAEEWGIVITSLAILLIAVAAAIAILRHRLYDIDLVINRTLVYGVLSLLIVASYVLIVGYVGQLLQLRGGLGLSLVATGAVAVMAHPLRERLQHVVNRFMYGERDDPYEVLSQLGQRLEATIAPDQVLPTIVEAVSQALKLPYAAIELNEGGRPRVAAEYGRPVDQPIAVPLTYQGEKIGRLLCAARGPGEEFNAAELRLLADVAYQAGLAVHAVQLTADLRRSRERLVMTREEERRRLRRDLHDGLGPELAGMMLKLDAAQNLIRRDPDEADRLLADLKDQTQDALGDIRRLVYNLRPPALDELGLVEAVRQRVDVGGAASGPRVVVKGPEAPAELPAAVEVAAYRIALEAVTNVTRHAGAARCEVRFNINDAFVLEVIDDGRGVEEGIVPGVGLTSMRERASELGGTVTLERGPEGGTRLLARLPIDRGEL